MMGTKPKLFTDLTLLARAVRAPFLTASTVPVLVGCSAAYYETGCFSFLLFLLTLVGVVSLHCGANVVNDYYDYLSGADPSHHPYPFHGGSQLLQAGLVTNKQVQYLYCFFFLLATACGLYLLLTRGAIILFFGGTGFFFGYYYTAPPLKFAYRGLGELVTGITFGPLSVLGTYYVQTQTSSYSAFLASLPLGFLITAVLYVNQFSDSPEDRAAGKNNLVVQLGNRAARPGLILLFTGAYFSLLLSANHGFLPHTTLLALLTLPLAAICSWYIYHYYDYPEKLAPASLTVIASHTGTGILLSLGYLLGI
jgi:1,4-dihydroxy-2-naphthoate octaprenyltransferase